METNILSYPPPTAPITRTKQKLLLLSECSCVQRVELDGLNGKNIAQSII